MFKYLSDFVANFYENIFTKFKYLVKILLSTF